MRARCLDIELGAVKFAERRSVVFGGNGLKKGFQCLWIDTERYRELLKDLLLGFMNVAVRNHRITDIDQNAQALFHTQQSRSVLQKALQRNRMDISLGTLQQGRHKTRTLLFGRPDFALGQHEVQQSRSQHHGRRQHKSVELLRFGQKAAVAHQMVRVVVQLGAAHPNTIDAYCEFCNYTCDTFGF